MDLGPLGIIGSQKALSLFPIFSECLDDPHTLSFRLISTFISMSFSQASACPLSAAKCKAERPFYNQTIEKSYEKNVSIKLSTIKSS